MPDSAHSAILPERNFYRSLPKKVEEESAMKRTVFPHNKQREGKIRQALQKRRMSMLLQCKNLTIRNAEADDARQLEAWWNDGRIMAHAGFPLGSGEKAEEIAARIARNTDEDRRLILELDGRAVGEMCHRRVDRETAEIGIKICDFSLHDRGLGKRYLSMLIRALFEDLGCRKIVLDTNLENLRAQHVYERLGFRRVRVNTDAWRDQLGRLQSSADYELTPENFVDFTE